MAAAIYMSAAKYLFAAAIYSFCGPQIKFKSCLIFLDTRFIWALRMSCFLPNNVDQQFTLRYAIYPVSISLIRIYIYVLLKYIYVIRIWKKNTWQSLIGPNLNRIKYFEEKIPKFQSPNAFFEPENFVRQQLNESVIVEYFNNNVCIKPIQTYYQNSIWRSPDKYFFSHMAPMDFRTFYHKIHFYNSHT